MGSAKHLCTFTEAWKNGDLSEKHIYQETFQTLCLPKSRSTAFGSTCNSLQTETIKKKNQSDINRKKAVGLKQAAGTTTFSKKWEWRAFWKRQRKQCNELEGITQLWLRKERFCLPSQPSPAVQHWTSPPNSSAAFASAAQYVFVFFCFSWVNAQQKTNTKLPNLHKMVSHPGNALCFFFPMPQQTATINSVSPVPPPWRWASQNDNPYSKPFVEVVEITTECLFSNIFTSVGRIMS